MKQDDFQFIYWPSSSRCEFDIDKYSGQLVDLKTTFGIDLSKIDLKNYPLPETETYKPSMPISQMENLAIQSGSFSRFASDNNIPREKFISLFKIWMRKSISGEMADEVLVVRNQERIIGMVTLSKEVGKGTIGLIAVDKDFRGKKIGQKLVQDALRWFVKNNCKSAKVVTQGVNSIACKLYEKCGFKKISSVHYYHFWLS
jgi:ribosomal protein S18 acetylase RimI-like enzyme